MSFKTIGLLFIFQIFGICAFAQVEICDNGIDDDLDGLVDCNDPDCASSTACEICYDEIPNDTFLINSVPGATVYTWTIPAGAVLVSQPADTMIIVDMTGSYPHVDSICVLASDAICGKDSICYYLNMIFCNDPPIAVNDTTSTNEDIAVTIPVYGNDTDPEGNLQNNTANVTGLQAPTNGAVSVNTMTGDLTYTPTLNFNGIDSFQYAICDSLNLCDTAWAFIEVVPVNDPPVADGDTDTTNEDTNVTITVSTNDSDVDGNLNISTTNIACTVCTSPSDGTLTNNGDGTFDYLPNQDFNGSDSFIYEVCDSSGLCDTAIVNITIDPVNDPPIAIVDRDTTDEDILVTVTVNTNDTDLENNIDPTTANVACTVCTSPSNGTLTNNGDGTFDYLPSANYNGSDNFIYEICDTDGLCDTAVVYLIIDPVNDPPVAITDSESGNEDTNIPIAASSNDTDLENNIDPTSTNVICPVCTSPSNGTLTNNGDGTFDYLPDLNYNGSDSFIYQICDTDNLCDTAVVNLTIIPVNDPPVAITDNETTPEGTPVLIASSSNDTDIELNIDPTTTNIACVGCTNPSNGTVTNNGDGTFTYTPNPFFYGNDNFIYQICDTGGLCDTTVVYITVDPVNDKPLATDDITATPEDIPVAIDVLNNDSDPNDPIGNIDPTSVAQVVAPNDGTISINPVTGIVTYTPEPNFTGIDAFQYEVCDDGYPLPPLCDTAVVTIVVSPVFDPPVANEDNEVTDEDVPVTISASANDLDVDGDLDVSTTNNICAVCTSPSNGTIVNNSDGTFTYSPNLNYFGTDDFIYEICDEENLCDTAVVNITINSLPDPPVANDDLNATLEDVSVTTPVVSNDTDGDGNLDPTTVTIIDDVTNGTTVVSPITGDITYVPNGDFNGQDTLTYYVCDLDNLCDTADLVITVVPTVDPPVAVDDGGSTPESTPITTDVLANDSDPDGDIDTSSVNVVSAPTNGSTSVNPLTGEITYTPNPNFYGTDTYSYEVCDMTTPTPNCDLADVTISVTPENNQPVANDDSETTPEDVAVLIDILANDNDNADPTANIDPTTVTIITPVSNGTTSIDPVSGEVTYTPDADFNGSDFFEYYVCDDGFPLPAKCDTARVDLTITPVNDPPVALDDVNVTNEESSVTTVVSGNDSDIDGNLDPTSVSIVSGPSNGTGTPDGSGGIIYTPATNFAGMDTITYSICDTDNLCDTADLVITVLPVTDGVIASDDSDTTPEDTPVTTNVLLNDNDPDGDIDTSSVVVTTPPNNGTTSVNPLTGEITYTPNPDFNGTDSYSYEVCDLTSPTPNCDIATVFLTITPTNDQPLAVDDTETTSEETPVAIDVTANDNDDDDPAGNIDPTTVMIVDNVSNGTTSVNPTTGVVTYTPDAGFYGNDTLTYVVCDDGNPLPALCDTAEVVLIVEPSNDPPIATDDSATTDEETPVTVDVASNDDDPNDPLGNIDPTSVGIVTPPSNGTTSINPTTGEITYTPNTDFVGNDTLEYVICDDGNPLPAQCDTAMVTFVVNPLNDQPLAVDDNASTPEDTPVDINVASNDNDPNDPLGNIDPLSTQVVTNPPNGTASVNPDGSINYDPDPNFVGLDSLTYSICDDGNPLPAQCDTATVYVNVSDVNDPPVADDDAATTDEDNPVVVDVVDGDTDLDGTIDSTSVGMINPPTNGMTSVDPVTGEITYTPDADFNGMDSFDYVVCDNDGLCDTATVNVTVDPVNDPPVAVDDANTTNEDVAVSTNVAGNDSDIDGNLDAPSVTILTNGSNGVGTANGAGSINYVPALNFTGMDTIEYSICDTDNLCDTAILVIDILAQADPLVANNDTDNTLEDTPVTTDVLSNDFDPDFDIDTSSVVVLSAPTNGTTSVNPLTGEITYTPDPDFNGTDSYTYQVCDETTPSPNCDDATVFITVGPVNDPPIAGDDTESTSEDTQLTMVVLNNDNDDADPAGGIDPSTVNILEDVNNGTTSVNGAGEIIYDPTPGFNGLDTLIYEVCDTGNPLPSLCDTAQVIITVGGVNDAPIAMDDTGTTNEDTPVVVDVAANDDDPNDPLGNIDPSTVTIVDQPDNGTVTVDLITGEITYTPDPNFNGMDTLLYAICDDGDPLPAKCDTAELVLTINDVNDPPVAVNDTTTVDEDMSISIDVPTNDFDLDGNVEPTTVSEITPPANGTTSIDPVSGEVTYTPNPDFNGTDQFEYAICDDDGACDTAVVIVNITPVNDPPVAIDDANTTNEEVTVTTNVLGNDTDIDGNLDPTSVTVLDDFENGLSTINPTTGAITYTPNTNYNGQDTLTYIVCDLDNLCDTADLVITVLMVTDGVVASDDFDTTPEDTPVTTAVLSNDFDPDNDIDTSSVMVISAPANGSTSVNPLTGDITYTPDPDFNGTDMYSYQVCDQTVPTANCDIATVFITVDPVNDPPVATDDVATATEEQPLPIDVTSNDSDPTDPSGNVDPTTVMIITDVTDGTTSVDPVTGVITYTSDPDFVGNDTLTYVVCDDGNPLPALCDTAEVIITVDPVNDPPIAMDDTGVTNEDTPVTVDVASNDDDPNDPSGNIDPTSVAIVENPDNGTVMIDPMTGEITYTPDSDFNGSDTLQYVICDDGNPLPAQCDTAELILTVNPQNDNPIAVDDTATTPENTLVSVDVALNDNDDADPNGNIDPTTVSIITDVLNGTTSVNPITGVIDFTPDMDFNGTDSLEYVICDDGAPLPAKCDTAKVYFNVAPVNNPPLADDDRETTTEDQPVTIDIASNDTDPNDPAGGIDPTSVSILKTPDNGSLVIDPMTGELTYTPDSDFNGNDTLSYVICDTGNPLPALCDTAEVIITVNPENDPPLAVDDTDTTPEDTPVTIPVTTNDGDPTDPNGNIDPGTLTVLDPPTNGSTTVNPVTGDITYTPDPNFNGSDTLTYVICDDGNPLPAECDTAQVIIAVTDVNDPPIAVLDRDTTDEDTPVAIDLPVNDSDLDGMIDLTSVTEITPPANGSISINAATGVATYTPNADFNGTDVFEYAICDDDGACDTAQVNVVINPVNDPPVAVDDVNTTNEENPLTTNVATNDFDIDGNLDLASVTIIDSPDNGTAVVNPGTDEIIYQPNANYNGGDTLTYVICDTDNLCDTADLVLTVLPVVDPVVAQNDSDNTTEDTPVTTFVLGNDFDPDGDIDTSSVTVLVPPTNGTTSVDPLTGNITYMPNPDFNGNDSYTYQVCDMTAPIPNCDDATVFVTVAPTNDPPIATDDVVAGNEDMPVLIDILANDNDDADPLGNIDPTSVTILDNPTNGTVSVDPVSGELTYDPVAGFNGSDTLTYIVCDDGNPLPAACDTAQVVINIGAENDPPIATNDRDTTLEDTPIVVDVAANDDDLNDPIGNIDPTTVMILNDVNHGFTSVDPATGEITYTPDPNYFGNDTLRYSICDDGNPLPAACDTAELYLVVTPVNDPPVGINDFNNTLVDYPVSGKEIRNDFDPEDDNITVNLTPVEQPANGTVILDATGRYIYTPNLGYAGFDDFKYEICDDGVPSYCDTVSVTIEVIELSKTDNNPPIANSDNYQTTINDDIIGGDLISNDGDPDGDNVAVNTTPTVLPTNGSVTINPDGTFDYSPNPGFVGADDFDYVICDDGTPTECDTATVFIEILPNPMGLNYTFATDDAAIFEEDTPASGNVLANDNDPDLDTQSATVSLIEMPLFGTVSMTSTGDYVYTPANGFIGNDEFVYEVCDDGSPIACDTATVYLTATPVNDPPVGVDDVNQTLVDTPTSGNVLTNDSDPEGDDLTVSTTPITDPTNGTVTIDASGNYTYTPDPGFTGDDSFEYEVCDDGIPQACDTVEVSINVIDNSSLSNNPPIATDDNFQTTENNQVAGSLISNDDDPDADPISLTQIAVSNPTNGILTFATDGTFTYTPDQGFVGEDVFEYEICDNGTPQLCDTAEVTINVIPNLAGDNFTFATDDAGVTDEDTPATGNVLANDNDPESDAQTANTTLVSLPANGNITLAANGDFVYTPDPEFSGNDQFVYEVCDNGSPVACDTATVYLTTLPVNDPPIGIDDINNTLVNVPVSGNVLLNDFDPEGDDLKANPTPVTAPANGTVTIDPLGNYTYTPATDFTGEDSFEYEVCDNGIPAECDTVLVTIEIIDVSNLDNNPPVAQNDNYTSLQDVTLDGNLASNDGDPDGDNIVVSNAPVSLPSNGTVNISGDGTFMYMPNPDFTGTDEFEYEICDDGTPTKCDTATAIIEILPDDNVVNSTFATDDAMMFDEDTPLTANVSANDNDSEGDNQVVKTILIETPTNGTISMNANGDFTYAPNADFNGNDQFVYEVCDDGSPVVCDTATVYLTTLPQNDPPLATDDTETVDEDTPVTIDVANNDDDPNDPNGNIDPTSVGVVTPPTNGTTSIDPMTGEVTYTPNPDFVGMDSLQYVICDDGYPLPAQCDSAWVVIDVTPVNDPPVFVDDMGNPLDTIYATLPEDSSDTTCVSVEDADLSNGTEILTCSILTPPSNGTAMVDSDTCVVYTPMADFNGIDSLVKLVCDNAGACDTLVVYYEVTPTNDPPLATDDTGTVDEDTPVTIDVANNDDDPNDPNGNIDPTSVDVVTPPTNGTTSIDPMTGEVTYTPDPDFVGTDSLQYVICDDGNPLPVQCDSAWVVIDVTPVNDPPVFVDDMGNPLDTIYAMLPEDSSDTTCVSVDDADLSNGTEMLTCSILTLPSNGTATVDSDTCVVYTPMADFNGIDSLVKLVCDNAGACDTLVVYYEVTPTNDPPLAMDDTGTVDEETPVTIDVANNDDDPNDPNGNIDPTSVGIVTPPTNGTTSIDPMTGEVTYTPDPYFVGTDSLQYVICDDGNPLPAQCDSAWVVIEVLPVNDPPIGVNDVNTTMIDEPVAGNVLTNDSDPNGDDLLVSGTPVTPPTNGTVTIDPDGNYIYTPDPGFIGTDVFEYGVCDTGVSPTECDTVGVTINVFEISDNEDNPPLANDDNYQTNIGTPVGGDILLNDFDFDGDSLTVKNAPLVLPMNGSVLLGSDGTFVYTPDPGFEGDDAFIYIVCDDSVPELCDTATVNITVYDNQGENTTYAVDDIENIIEDTQLISNALTNDYDLEGDNQQIVTLLVEQPSNGSVSMQLDGGYIYTPALNYHGNDEFVYAVCDDGSPIACDTATVYLTVLPSNDPIMAVNDTTSVNEDEPVLIDVMANDTDPFDPTGMLDSTSVGIVTPPTNGTATVDTLTGEITYVPNPDFVGTDTLAYSVCDDEVPPLCDTAYVFIEVLPVPDPPTAIDDVDSSFINQTDSIYVLINDFDIDGEDVSIVNAGTNASNSMTTGGGSTSVNDNGTPGDLTDDFIEYTPAMGFVGLDSFYYYITDGTNRYDTALVVIDISIPAEDCSDGIDNDLDGLTDCDDPDCGYAGPIEIVGDCFFLKVLDTQPDWSYEWYRNGVLIAGETNSTYIPNPGTYAKFSVRVTNGNGCTSLSAQVEACCAPPVLSIGDR